MAKMKSFCKSGTVLFVSHDPSAILEFCSRAIWIERGEVRMDGSPKLVTEKYLEYMYESDKPYKTSRQDNRENHLFRDRHTEKDISDHFVRVPDEARQFGNKNANMLKVAIRSDGGPIGVLYSGKPCEISIIFETHQDIRNPIIGFLIKDRLGREIIGDNTALMCQNLPFLLRGKLFKISFFIKQWPNICGGNYIVSIGIADGSLEDHEQCQWIHESMVFESIPLRSPAGIFSVLDTNVEFTALKP
jgi:lipopolysaccharide transport system ATP-binding protein